MKKITKKLATFALSATFAVSAGAAIGVVAYNHTPITASAEQTKTAEHDLAEAFVVATWAGAGDYTEALLYRIKSPSYTAAYWSEAKAAAGLNHALGETVMKNVLVNGKSIYDHNAEYKTLIESGETSPITWTGMPENTGAPSGSKQYMPPEIASDVNGGKAVYAPILLKLCHHEGYGNSIDIYIPTSYLAANEVKTIKFTKDFYYETNGTSFGVSDDVTFVSNLFGATKHIGEVEEFTPEIEATKVTQVKGASNAGANGWDSFLRFYLETNDYGTSQTQHKNTGLLGAINFLTHIEFNGKKYSEYVTSIPGEQFFNVWGESGTFAVRWPVALNNAAEAGKITEIKILKGCQFPSLQDGNLLYEVQEDMTFVLINNYTFVNEEYILTEDNVNISNLTLYERGEAEYQDELYKVEISYENWNSTCNIFDYNYFGVNNVNLRKSILINDVSLYDINTTVDDSEYVYTLDPWNQTEALDPSGSGYQLFNNPTVVTGEGDTLTVYIHKDYIASLDADIEVTLVEGFIHPASSMYFAKEAITATVYQKPYTLTLRNGNPMMGGTMEEVEYVSGATLELPTLEATGKEFKGWFSMDENDEPTVAAPATMPAENIALYAVWEITPYTLTIVNGEEETEFTFAVEYTNDILISVNDLAYVLEDNLPADSEEFTYAWAEEVPETFELQNYTFTVVATEKTYTVSVITGNPRENPSCVTTTEHKYNDTFKVTELVAPTATGKTFAGWIDVEGNAITEDFAITESTSIFASWTVTPYTLTIKQEGKEDVVITFGVEYTNDILVSVNDLAFVLEDNLPADSEEFTYAWAEEVPETFELQNYTFTVVATPVEDTSSDTSSGDESTDTPNKPAKSGCGSAIGSTLAITGIALAASALIIKKRKED